MLGRILCFSFSAILIFSLFSCSPGADSQKPEFSPSPQTDENNAETPVSPSPSPDAAVPLSISFSEVSGFYGENVSVALSATDANALIYYTLDGSDPFSENAYQYKAPIKFHVVSGNVMANTLKAGAVLGNEKTPVVTNTYICGKEIEKYFDTLIFSLTTDARNLYDYEYGILIPGKLRDDWQNENPGKRPDPPDPANFNLRGKESERPVHVEVFESDGVRVLDMDAGVRVHGGWSRAETQKSLRLIARKDYTPDAGKFTYDFFPDDGVKKYDGIVLRNGANDRDFGMIRNETALRLARDAGFPDLSPNRPAAVFLNGEYYGFAWLEVDLNEKYLADVYRTDAELIQVCGNGELWIETDDDALREALDYVNGFAWKDLTNDTIFDEFSTLVDVDDMLLYYALEIYMGNDDWPGGNMKRWRYAGEPSAAPLDGRWRYIMYDVDWTFGLYGDGANKPTLSNVLGGSKHSYALDALLKRPDMRERFKALLLEIGGGALAAEKVAATIDAVYAEAQNEIAHAFNARKYSSWVNQQTVLENHENMKRFAAGRLDYITSAIERLLPAVQ